MTPAQARVISDALKAGGVVDKTTSPVCLRALVRDGLAVWRGPDLVITEAGRKRFESRQRRSAAASAPELVIVDGVPVDLRQRCTRCGAQFGSHMRRVGYPLPERKCPGFTRGPRPP